MKYIEAFDLVKSKRAKINPNLGFCIELRKYDEYHKENSGDLFAEIITK